MIAKIRTVINQQISTGEIRAITNRQIAVPALVVIVALSTSSLLWVFPKIYPVRDTVIKVDMQTNAGKIIEVYLNGSGQPLRQKISVKKRTLYTFPVDENVDILRVDPTDVSGAEINIYSIAIEDTRGVIRHFQPDDLKQWNQYNLKSREVVNGSFHFFGANSNPAIASMVNAPPLRRTAYERWAFYAVKLPTGEFLPSLIAVSFVLLLSVALLSPSRFLHLPLAYFTVLALLGIIPLVVARYRVLAAASTSVGGATYFGRSVRANQVAMLLVVVATCLLAVGAWLLLRRLLKLRWFSVWAASAGSDASSRSGLPRKWAAVLVVCSLGLIYFPDLRELATVFQNRLFPPDWDWYNLTYWAYLAHKGFVPLRDFWYPYSGFYVFDLPLSTGAVLRWLYMWCLLSIFFFNFYRLSGYRLAAALPATALIVIGDRGLLLGDSYRYLLGVDLVLSYLAIDHARRDWTAGAIWFWLSCALALFFEPVQLVYASAAIAAKLALDFWQSKPRLWPVWRRRMLREFSIPLASVVLVLAWLGAHGQLRGFIDFNLRIGDLTVYSAIPTNLVEGLKRRLSVNFLALAVPPMLIAIGLFERLRTGKPGAHADALLGLGLLGYLLCQKHLVREMAPEMLPVFLAGLLAYVLLWQGRRSYLEYVSASIIAGVFLLLTIQTGSAGGVLKALKSSPRKIIDSIRLMGSEKRLLDEANRVAYAPERFLAFPDELRINAWMANQNNGERAKVFALSDDAILYILSEQPPVYQSNLYSTSPLYEQQALVRWLEATKPEYVTLDPTMTTFDGIPNAVRCPFVFERVIADYVPQTIVGNIEILRRRQGGEPIALTYWREKLGSVLYLGHLPRVSSFSRFQPCQPESGAGCVDFLRIHMTRAHPEARVVEVPVEAGGRTFTLEFQTLPFQDTYYVFLDRIWFWKTVKDQGGTVSIPKQRVPEGMETEIIPRQDLQDVLY